MILSAYETALMKSLADAVIDYITIVEQRLGREFTDTEKSVICGYINENVACAYNSGERDVAALVIAAR